MNDSMRDAARARLVRKSNELVQKARYKLDVVGQKVLLYLISRIRPEDTAFKTEQITIAEICDLCDINDSGKNYKIIKDALSGLLSDSARVWIPIDDEHITPLTWIEPPVINRKTGKITVKLNDTMRPYLLDLKRNYTQYELIYTLRFRSKYSIRLYEIIKSYQYHDDEPFIKVYDVDEIKTLLDAENYIQYRDFKKRVLSIATEEINRYTDKILEINEKVVLGRKVNQLEFVICAKIGDELDEVRQLIGAPQRRRRIAKQIDAQMSIDDIEQDASHTSNEDKASNDKLEYMKRMYEHLKQTSVS